MFHNRSKWFDNTSDDTNDQPNESRSPSSKNAKTASAIYTALAVHLLASLPSSANAKSILLTNGNDYLEEEYQPILPEGSASRKPLGYTFTRNLHLEQRHGLLGCLHSKNLCNQDEHCLDDGLFGSCVSPSHENENPVIISPTPAEKELLDNEVARIAILNYQLEDPYAQCLLQALYDTIQRGIPYAYDTELCELAFQTTAEDFEELFQRKADEDDFHYQDYPFPDLYAHEEEPANADVEKTNNNHQLNREFSANPEEDGGMLTNQDDFLVKSREDDVNAINPAKFLTKWEKDGGILIDPDQAVPYEDQHDYAVDPFLYAGYEGRNEHPSVWPDEMENELDLVEPFQRYGGSASPPKIKAYFQGEIDEPVVVRGRRGVVSASQDAYQVGKYDEGDDGLSSERENDGDDGSEYLDNLPPYLDLKSALNFPDVLAGSSEAEPDVFLEYPAYYGPTEDRTSSLGDSNLFLFNRNERLDVKKPGPFFPSEESLLLKAIQDANTDGMSGEENAVADPFGPKSTDRSSDERGQEEYELPILAPVKDKRVLHLAHPEKDEKAPGSERAKNNFVHLRLNTRFKTRDQGENLINNVARNFGISEHALADRVIEDHDAHFRVDPNPQDVDAQAMADLLVSNEDIRKRISDRLGVDIAKASAGEKYDFFGQTFFKGNDSMNVTSVFLVCGTALAALAAMGVMLLIRKRCQRQTLQTKPPSGKGAPEVQEEYKQLCRDWSRSSKTSERGVSCKQRSSTKSGGSPPLTSQDSKGSDKSSKSSGSSWNEEPASNMDISTGHMVLAYMEDHLKNKQRLEQEWVGLCSYEAEPCTTTTAFKADNKKKNRYPDKLPYDHNRVVLNAALNASNSDYINASTVSDHDPRNPSYIVTQGPLGQTIADFWQMIWEQGCVVIVMLTKLQDNGYQLCQRYWPEEGSEQYHIFEVHLVSEHAWCEDYLVRSVYLKNTRTGETRTVTQFHFLSWPAQSVPSSTKALLEFRRKVNKSYRGGSCPIAIHCSDGVGRSGTYVLIDMVLNRMAKGCKEIDIAATLEHIRDQRSGMVQTRPQFEFSLHAVAEEVHAILKALPP